MATLTGALATPDGDCCCAPAVTYNCVAGVCVDPGDGSGTYTGATALDDCAAACSGTISLPCCTSRTFPDTLYLSGSGGSLAGGTFPAFSGLAIPFYSQPGGPGTQAFWQLGTGVFYPTGVFIGGHQVFMAVALSSCDTSSAVWAIQVELVHSGVPYRAHLPFGDAMAVTCSPFVGHYTDLPDPDSELPGWSWTVTE